MAKGGQFERETCVTLSLWWSRGEHDDVFWRAQTSGARATTRAKKGKRTRGQVGDIAATHPSGKPLLDLFCIELKRGYPRSSCVDALDRLPREKPRHWEAWVLKAAGSVESAGSRTWMLIAKRDRRRTLVFMPLRWWATIECCIPLQRLQRHDFAGSVTLDLPDAETIVGMPFEYFLKVVTPKVVKRVLARG